MSFEPLYPGGLHTVSLKEIKRRCVTDFPLSKTRGRLFEGMKVLFGRVGAQDEEIEAWLDGSFLTNKIDPNDIDIVLVFNADRYDDSIEYRETLDWAITQEATQEHFCHCFAMPRYPEGHKHWVLHQAEMASWRKLFGHSRDGGEKGIAVVRVGDLE
jgi:hypothetical protein